jgi:hypothetical protein
LGKVAGAMALIIVRKEPAMIEWMITMSFGLAYVCQLNLLIIPYTFRELAAVQRSDTS